MKFVKKVKSAIQRAVSGFDDEEINNFEAYFFHRTLKILKAKYTDTKDATLWELLTAFEEMSSPCYLTEYNTKREKALKVFSQNIDKI